MLLRRLALTTAMRPRRHATTVIAAPTKANEELLAACPAFASYAPCPWLPGRHGNTIGSALLRRAPPRGDGSGAAGLAYAARTLLPVDGGGVVALDWHTRPLPRQPVLVVLHGLTGGSHETYVQWLVATTAREVGLCVVVMNARGCAGSALASPRTFCAAGTGDVRSATAHVRSVVGPGTPIFHAGFSLGAGILAKWAADDGDAADSAGAVAVAAAYDLIKSSAALSRGWNHALYDGMLCRSLQGYYRRHAAVLRAAPWCDEAATLGARTVRQFDAAAIVPQFGYADVDAYYRDASAGPRLAAVRVPLLALNAADDPICCVSGLLDAADAIRANPAVVAVVTQSGGHVAWASGAALPLGRAWDNVAACQWYAALLARRGYDWGPGSVAAAAKAGVVPLPVEGPAAGKGDDGGAPAVTSAPPPDASAGGGISIGGVSL